MTVHKTPTRTNPFVASIALGLMFVSLIVIYLVAPQNNLVTTFSVMIVTITLFIGLFGSHGDLRFVTVISALVSLLAAGFLGNAWFGTLGSILLPSIWFIVLVWGVRQLRATTLVIPEDHAVMVAPFLSSQVYMVDPGQAMPLMFLDRHVATVPLYELTQDVRVKKINTAKPAPSDIDELEVHIRYKVEDPEKALVGIPNRGRIQNEVAKDLGQSLSRARLDVAFWEKLLGRQMSDEVDDIVRDVIFSAQHKVLETAETSGQSRADKTETSTMIEIYGNRKDISRQVHSKLSELVRRWGVVIDTLDLDFIALDKEMASRIKSPPPKRLKEELEADKLRREADARNRAFAVREVASAVNETEAQRVKMLIEKLQNSDVSLSSKQLEEIVLSAIRAGSEHPLEEAYSELFEPNRSEKVDPKKDS